MTALLAAVAVVALAPFADANLPIYKEPPPREALELLELLAGGTVSVETLRPIISGAVSQRFGRKYLVGGVLGVAVREGAVAEETVVAAMKAEGCEQNAHPEGGPCGRLVDAFQSGIKASSPYRLHAMAAESAETEIASVRSRVLKAEREFPAGNTNFRARYAELLVSREDSPLVAALKFYLIESPDELADAEDRKVFRAMGRVTVKGVEQDWINPLVFNGSFLVAFRERIEPARGDPAIVAEVRAIPEDLLARVRAKAAKTTSRFDDRVACVLDAWRKGTEPPNRWLAWKQQLICQGW